MNPSEEVNSVLRYLFPPVEESVRLRVACRRGEYCASRIAHAVEDCNAHLLNLNVTAGTGDTAASGDVIVEIRAALRNPEALARSIERYDMRVLDVEADTDPDNDTVRQRVNELIHYLEL